MFFIAKNYNDLKNFASLCLCGYKEINKFDYILLSMMQQIKN